MTNPIALFLGIAIVGAIVLDVAFFGTEHLLFLSKKFMDLITWVAFWR